MPGQSEDLRRAFNRFVEAECKPERQAQYEERTFSVPGKPGITAEQLAMELDIHVDRVADLKMVITSL